jgi:cytoskeletal protein RodZ
MNVVWGALAAVVAFLMLLGAAVRGVWRAATAVQEWVGALKANTEATQSLSGDLKNLSTTTSKTLTEHGTTLTEHGTTLVEHGERLGRLENP